MCFHVTGSDSIRHALVADGLHKPIEQNGVVVLLHRSYDTGLCKTFSSFFDEITGASHITNGFDERRCLTQVEAGSLWHELLSNDFANQSYEIVQWSCQPERLQIRNRLKQQFRSSPGGGALIRLDSQEVVYSQLGFCDCISARFAGTFHVSRTCPRGVYFPAPSAVVAINGSVLNLPVECTIGHLGGCSTNSSCII